MRNKKTITELLKEKLSDKEIKAVPKSYDIVGDILLFIDFPDELKRNERFIGECFLKFHKNIKVVAKKTESYSGRFRTPKIRIIAGARRKNTEHKENNVRLRLDVEKTYFSARLANERLRIAKQVKNNEDVLVMFSGVGPYVCVIAKNTGAKSVTGIEINKKAHHYAEENIRLNKIKNAEAILGDVREIVPKLDREFDRIIMPLPKGGEDFLGLALSRIKKKGIVHFYDFLHEKEFKNAEKKIKKACRESSKKCKILGVVKCGQYAPRTYRICVDFQVSW